MVRLVTWVLTRKRLLMEYLLLAMFLVTGGLSVGMWAAKKGVTADLEGTRLYLRTVSEKLEMAHQEIQVQQQQLEQMKKTGAANSVAIHNMITQWERVNRENDVMRSRLQDLERKDPSVANWLDVPIPDALGGLLNSANAATQGTGRGAGGKAETRRAAAAVPGGAVRQDNHK